LPRLSNGSCAAITIVDVLTGPTRAAAAHSGQAMTDPVPPGPAPVTPATPRRRRRLLPWSALLLPLAGWTALATGAATPLKDRIARHASATLGREVAIGGDLRVLVTPFSIHLAAGDVRIANPRWAMEDDLLRAARLEARLSIFDLMIGRPALRALALRGGTLDLERSRRAGRTNWAVGKAGTLLDPAGLRRIDGDDLAVRYRDFAAGTDVRLTLAGDGPGAIRLAGGGTIAAHAVRVRGSLQTAEDEPARLALAARAGGVDLAVSATAQSPLALARSELSVGARGKDAAALAALAGIALPAMPGFDLQARLSPASRAWHFSRIDGRVGRTDLAGTLILDRRGERPRLVARLSSRTLDPADGRALLGLAPATGQDPASQDPAGQDPAGRSAPLTAAAAPRLLPDVAVSRAALHGFDAVIDYAARQIAGTGQAPGHLTMRLALTDGRLMVSPASIDLAGGFVSADILIDARRSPALARYDIRLSPTPMDRLLAGWGIAAADNGARARGRIQLTGRGDTLRETLAGARGRIALVLPAGTVAMRRASAAPLDMANLGDALFRTPANDSARLNCGLVAFTVTDGVARADPILIDTDDAVISARGTLDLRAETIDLRLSAQGKRFAFFARPSPVIIAGALADPRVSREPVALFRPASLFGLPLALPDLRAIFGFVDPDEADAPACGPILQARPADAQRPREMAALR
jgi:uncharacterized protein involved in outer membrane biogenesis